MSAIEPLPGTAITVRADDAMNCIAAACRRCLGREPSFAEVKDKYDLLAIGFDLSAVLEQIEPGQGTGTAAAASGCDEAMFASILTGLYRDSLGRVASDPEVASWYQSYRDGAGFESIAHGIIVGPEADAHRRSLTLDDRPDGLFIQAIYETILHRGAAAGEISYFAHLLANGAMTRQGFVSRCLQETFDRATASTMPATGDDVVAIYGRDEPLDRSRWIARRQVDAKRDERTEAAFPYTKPAETSAPLVSVVTSLYRGGDFIDAFLENMTSQSIFEDCELIIIDAASPDAEAASIQRVGAEHPNIVYRRLPYRTGVYAAWNFAISLAKGAYVTNANVDDCRRHDSLERQAATLQRLPFVDIVHQDVFYSLEANLPFAAIAAANFKTNLPSANPYSLMEFNSPHNAPMWRRALHDEIGPFDEFLESAGDFDFWLRCAAKGKTFYKLNDAHVGYYRNPDGVSSRPGTAGHREGDVVKRRHARSLVSPELTMSRSEFDGRLGALSGRACATSDRMAAVREALLASEAGQPA